MLQELIASSDLYAEGYVDMDEFLAAMVANSSYSKTKDAVRTPTLSATYIASIQHEQSPHTLFFGMYKETLLHAQLPACLVGCSPQHCQAVKPVSTCMCPLQSSCSWACFRHLIAGSVHPVIRQTLPESKILPASKRLGRFEYRHCVVHLSRVSSVAAGMQLWPLSNRHCVVPLSHFRTLQLRRSFDALDQDHDGFITSADLLNLQQQLLGQHHMTKELAEDMMSEVSTCISDIHDGKMDFEEVGLLLTQWTHAGRA